MITRSLSTELLLCLWPSRQISKAIAGMGVAKDSREILVVRLHAPSSHEGWKVVEPRMAGTPVELASGLTALCDTEELCRIYGIEAVERAAGDLIGSVVTRIACKDALSSGER